MTQPTGSDADDVATQVADRLKEAFAAVGSSSLTADQRGRWQQRLIAVTNMAKHDVTRAAVQLDRLVREWNALDAGKEIAQ